MKKSLLRLPGLALGLLLMLGGRLMPALFGLSPEAMQALCIFLGAVWLWLFVDIAWPSVLALLMLATLPKAGTQGVISAAFGNTTIWFLVFSFLLTHALHQTGFLRRMAFVFINSPLAKKSPWAFVFMYLSAVLILGSFIAPTVTFLLFFALHKEAMAALQVRPGHPLARALMIGIACVTSISCAMTPIAHTFPLLALGFYQEGTGEAISYLSYLKIGLPVGLVLFILVLLLLFLAFRKQVQAAPLNLSQLHLQASQAISQREAFSALVFFGVVLVWLLSGIDKQLLPQLDRLGTVWPAMAGVVLLSAVPIQGKPALDIKEGMSKGISWVSILLCAAALALGKYLTLPDYGITALIGQKLSPLMSLYGAGFAFLVLIACTILMTNFMSNIVTTTVMYGVAASVIPALIASGIGVDLRTAAILVGLCASLAFATPPAIAHIALAAGSDWASPRDMLLYGGLMAALSIPVVLLFTLLSHQVL